MTTKMTQVNRDNLQYFWEKVKEYYSQNNHPVASSNSLYLSDEENLTGQDLIDLINQAVEDLKGGVSEDLDTFKKLATWTRTYFTSEDSFVNTISRLDSRIDNLIIGGYDLGPVSSDNPNKPSSGADIASYTDNKVSEEETRAKGIEQDLTERIEALENTPIELGPVLYDNDTQPVSGRSVVTYVDNKFTDAETYTNQQFGVLDVKINTTNTNLASETATRSSETSALNIRVTALEEGGASKAYTDQQVGIEEARAKGVEQGLDTRITALEEGGASQDYTDEKVAEEAAARETADSALDTRVTALEEGGASQDYTDEKVAEEAAARETADSALDTRVTALESLDLSDVKEDVSELQTSVESISTSVSTLSSTVEDVQSSISDVEDALSDVNDRVQALEEVEIDDTVTSSSENAVKSSGIASYIDAVKADISLDVTTQLAPIATSLSNHKSDKNNPHEVTAEQLGIGAFKDLTPETLPVSTAVQEALDELEDKIPSDVGDLEEQVSQMGAHLYDHTQNTENPHHVTAEQVGLGSFDGLTPETLPISTSTQEALTGITETLTEHTSNKSNPHEVTAKQLGLDKVVNKGQSSSYIIEDGEYDSEKDEGRYFTMHGANQMYVHFTERTNTLNSRVSEKLDADTVRDGLTFDDIDKPLSANQGMILNGLISNVTTKVNTLASPLVFKGVVTLVDDLTQLTAANGDVYQVSSTEEFYACNKATEPESPATWIQIFVNVDIVNYMSDIDDAYDIIDNYGNEEEEIDG